jgi:hypothetical protein
VDQDYLGVDKIYYRPTDRGYEAHIAERMRRLREDQTGSDAEQTNERRNPESNAIEE